MESRRAKPFSGSQKKKQLQEKRAKKKAAEADGEQSTSRADQPERHHGHDRNPASSRGGGHGGRARGREHAQQAPDPHRRGAAADRLKTAFVPESKEEIQRRVQDSRRALTPESREPSRTNGAELAAHEPIPIPRRPPWSREMTPEELEASETAAFERWLKNVHERHAAERLNDFEHNLEVWRQLWRVVEKSDVLLIVLDGRFPGLLFPPSLHDYVCGALHKPAVLVLNKADLVPPEVLEAWRAYFARRWSLPVAFFSSRPDGPLPGGPVPTRRRRGGGGPSRPARGVREVLGACAAALPRAAAPMRAAADAREAELAAAAGLPFEPSEEAAKDGRESGDESDSSSCESGAEAEQGAALEGQEAHEDEEEPKKGEEEEEEEDDEHQQKRPAPPFTIGLVGPPNSGKSSLINALVGRKVVSTSRTPGHTKHFQTIHIGLGLRLCDCPGLVFPSLDVPRALQVLCGVYPIAQVREPYSSIRLLAHRVPLPSLYRIDQPASSSDLVSPAEPWSPWSICETLALRRGFLTRGGRPDVNRAANAVLRDCAEGRLPYYHTPPRDRGRRQRGGGAGPEAGVAHEGPTAVALSVVTDAE